MSGYPLVLLLASLPALGNFAGALLAEVFDVSERALSLALHLAAGIVLGVIGIELMPRTLGASLPWVPLVAFVVGGALFLGLERLIGYAKGRLGGDDRTGPLAIFSGVSIDLFSDGILIGTGSIISPSLGFLLAIGQVPDRRPGRLRRRRDPAPQRGAGAPGCYWPPPSLSRCWPAPPWAGSRCATPPSLSPSACSR